jgi:hypothetical protein
MIVATSGKLKRRQLEQISWLPVFGWPIETRGIVERIKTPSLVDLIVPVLKVSHRQPSESEVGVRIYQENRTKNDMGHNYMQKLFTLFAGLGNVTFVLLGWSRLKFCWRFNSRLVNTQTGWCSDRLAAVK